MSNEREYRDSVRTIGKRKTHQNLTFRKDFPIWLKSTLKSKGLSQRQLANETEICETLISRWVNGERPPHVLHVIILAQYFGCTTDEICGIK